MRTCSKSKTVTMSEKRKNSTKYVTKSIENFTTEFHKTIANKVEGNLISSALSVYVALSMAAYGAKSKTAEEMRKVLRLPDNNDEAYEEFQNLIDTLDGTSYVILKLANRIFTSNIIKVKDEFRKLTEVYFRSECKLLNFENAIESAKIANQWCADQTNGKIQEILFPDEISSDFTIILLNAVYFKGNWKYPFNKALTRLQPFHVNRNTVIQSPIMYIKRNFLYRFSKELNAQCVILPYENDNVFIEIVVPVEIDGLKYIEENLEKINENEESKYLEQEVEVFLPRFKISSVIDLQSHLEEMGMKELFANSANFEDIADEPMRVDKVIQKAFIEVNEEGSEGATVTSISEFNCLPPDVRADRPFFFRISIGSQIIFSGHVVNPADGLPVITTNLMKPKFSKKISKCSII